jgi:glutaredoxin
MTKNATVWTKKGSQDCLAAVKALKALGYTVEEKALKSQAEIEAFRAAYPGVKTVPLIVVDETVVGGLDSIGSLPEALTARAAKASKDSARTPHTTRAERWDAKKAATAAKKEESLGNPAARKAAWATNPANLKQNPTGTRADRHVAKQAQIQATLTRRAAAQPVPPTAPEGYQIGAPKTASLEEKTRRFTESKAAREAKKTAALTNMSEARTAKVAALHARLGTSH